MGDIDEEGCDVCNFYLCRCGQPKYRDVNVVALAPDVWMAADDGWDVFYTMPSGRGYMEPDDGDLIEVEWRYCEGCGGQGFDAPNGVPITCDRCRGGGVECF